MAPAHPAIVITHGLPGSGKSTLALQAVERLGAIRIRSDVERKRLHGMQPLDRSHSAIAAGLYGEEATRRTYARLLAIARDIVAAGHTVIVDAAFLRKAERTSFMQLAQQLGVPFIVASISASEHALRSRIAERLALATDASEAGLEVLGKLRKAQEPLSREELPCAVEFCNEGEAALNVAPGWVEIMRRVYPAAP